MSTKTLLQVRGVSLETPGGRPLFRDLSLTLTHGERVALIGRNGAGKSTLLDVLAGNVAPDKGQILSSASRILVPQQLPPRECPERPAQSPGEIRKRLLLEAREARPDLLLLDEPTHDLDEGNIHWLVDWLRSWPNGLLVVSHDRRMLRVFDQFFVVAESGCRHFSGTFDALIAHLNDESELQQARYARNLSHLLDKERRSDTDRRRRQRKKNLGRLHELGRCPSRLLLNDKRSYAQEKQGKRDVRREARLDAAREWARATRRALAVDLPLEMALPKLPEESGAPVVILEGVSARAGKSAELGLGVPGGVAHERLLFEGVSLQLARDRLGIMGPNGSGKTALVEILTGERKPDAGRVICDSSRIGYVAQNTANWCSDESVLDHLLIRSDAVSSDAAVRILRAHKFPFALAERSLISLSPGERLRAALICLWHRRPVPELLVLDEPTSHLDFVGMRALESVLAAWPGGLVVVSHDEEFLRAIGVKSTFRVGDVVVVSR